MGGSFFNIFDDLTPEPVCRVFLLAQALESVESRSQRRDLPLVLVCR